MAVVGILLGMAVLATGWSSINMALAEIQRDLGASVLQLQWMMNIYGIFICIPLLTVGKLGDAYGRKKFYQWGLFGLGLACLGAAFARAPEWIILCMGLFGLSAASVLTLSQALIVHQYPEGEKGKAVALWATFTSLALAAGPLVGGVILRYLSWRWIFFIDVPIAALSLFLVFRFVKKEATHSTHCDWSGVALLALIVGAVVTATMQGPNWGWSSPQVIGLFAVALIAIFAFIAIEKKSQEPMFRPDLFSHAGFLFPSMCNGCLIGFIWSIFFFIPLYLQNGKGLSPLETGLTMLLITLPVAFFSVFVSKLYNKIGAKPLLVAGFLLFLLSVFFQKSLTIQGSCLLMGFGWVLTWGPSTSRALIALPHHMAGIASGMFMTLQEIGGVMGLAVSGVVFRMGTSRYLAPHMEEIQTVFGERTQSILSNPVLVEKTNPRLAAWLHDGFSAGYSGVLWFLVFLMAAAAACAFFLPKEKKS
jgi:EmrB/QacA subfamily drug resistance transporter